MKKLLTTTALLGLILLGGCVAFPSFHEYNDDTLDTSIEGKIAFIKLSLEGRRFPHQWSQDNFECAAFDKDGSEIKAEYVRRRSGDRYKKTVTLKADEDIATVECQKANWYGVK